MEKPGLVKGCEVYLAWKCLFTPPFWRVNLTVK